MPTTVLYRISSGEVVKISTKGQTFSDRDTTYWGVLTDPNLPDGTKVFDPADVGLTPRALDFAKIWDGTDVRNATQAELDGFAAPETDDENTQDAAAADDFLQTHPRFRKIFKAMLKRIIAENNTQAAKTNDLIVAQWNQFKTDVASSANLGQLQTAVAALPTIAGDLPTRTLAQAVTALTSDISKDD